MQCDCDAVYDTVTGFQHQWNQGLCFPRCYFLTLQVEQYLAAHA